MKVTTPEYQPRLALEAMRLIDNVIAIQDDPDFYSMRVAAAYVADRAEEVLETTRRLIYIFNQELSNAEQGRIEVTAGAIEFKLRQIEVVRTVVRDIKARHADVPAYKTELLSSQLGDLVSRLEALQKTRA